MLGAFDWEARSRVVEGDGRIEAAILVQDRPLPGGPVARLEVAGAERAPELLEWGLRLARAAGARSAQVWRGRGHGDGLPGLGFQVVRPFWRMDRPDLEMAGAVALPGGYRIVDEGDGRFPAARWVEAVNSAFAEHWQHVDLRLEDFERRRARPDHRPGLSVLAVDGGGGIGAAVLSHLEVHEGEDSRAQPVGLVAIVGTLPAHRRRGLAGALLMEVLQRLRTAGARSASLYVDGRNPTGAADVYRRAGFEVAYEFEVWEAPLTT